MTNPYDYNALAKFFAPSPTEEEKKTGAWANATPTAKAEWRYDCDGRAMAWSEYGRYSEYGWQIDHIVPVALGGSDLLTNLRARHWRGNSAAGGLLGGVLGSSGGLGGLGR